MVGTHWLWVALYFWMSFSASSASKMLHDDDGAAEALGGHAPAERRGVIERRGREIDRILVEAVEKLGEHGETCRLVDLRAGQRMPDALGPARGARGIEHVGAGGFVGDGRRGEGVAGGLVSLVAHDVAADAIAALDLRDELFGDELGGDRLQRLRGKEDARAAIADDIGDFARRQARGNAGVIEAGALRGPADLEVADVVVHEDRDGVAGLQARVAKEMGELVRTLVELLERHGLAGRGHDVGRFRRRLLRVNKGMHQGPLPGY